jgi:hypothetical protein
MRRLFTCLSLIVCAHLLAATGTTSHALSTECPTITIETPSSTVCPTSKVTFTASVSGGGSNAQPKFHWTVSSGKIISGQGTPTITVSTVDEYGHGDDNGLAATVEVVGQGANCSNTASYGVRISAFCPERKFDEYGDLSFDEEKVRLENFIDRLQQDKDTLGLIVFHAQVNGRGDEAEARAERARNYIVNLRGIDRVATKDGGGREALTVELWVMPTKAPSFTGAPTANSNAPPVDSDPTKNTTP